MRFLAGVLALCTCLFSVDVSFAASILPAPCTGSPLPAICTFQSTAGGLLILTSGAATPYRTSPYPSINGLAPFDYPPDLQSMKVGTLGSISSDSIGHFDVSFAGMHAYLEQDGQYSDALGGLQATGAFEGTIIDALATTTLVPGSSYNIYVSIHAIGNSVSNPLGKGDIYSSSLSPSFTGGNSVSCSNLDPNVRGSLSNDCVLSIPIVGVPGLNLASPFSVTVLANTFSLNGRDVLDLTNTVKIDQITLVDSFGNVIPDAVIYDASGYNYNTQSPTTPSSTPEPSSVILTSTGFAIGLWLAFRKLDAPQPQQ